MFDKNKIHMIPAPVQDHGDSALSEKVPMNVRLNYISRIEAIRAYCEWVITQFNRLTKR